LLFRLNRILVWLAWIGLVMLLLLVIGLRFADAGVHFEVDGAFAEKWVV